MKTTNRICLIALLCTIGLSCQDEKFNDVNRQKKLSQMKPSEQVEYARQNLRAIGNATVFLASKDLEFRNMLYSEIERTFDGDYNVLIKDLSSASITGKKSAKFFEAMISVTGNSENAEATLNAFQDVESTSYFPQVFIPFYEELKGAGKIGTSQPIIVIATGDQPTFPGYKLNEKGQLVDSGLIVDESYARQNEVWVISLNERVDSKGEVRPDFSEGRTQTSYPNARFYRMRVGLHKEEWVAGASEVHIKRYLSFYAFDAYSVAPHAQEVSSGDDASEGDGKRIYQFTRSDVDQNKLVTLYWVYVDNWPARQGNIDGTFYHLDYLYYIIFEYDAWPTGKRTQLIYDTTGNSETALPIDYRSADTPYKTSYIPEISAEGFVLNDTYIGFISQY